MRELIEKVISYYNELLPEGADDDQRVETVDKAIHKTLKNVTRAEQFAVIDSNGWLDYEIQEGACSVSGALYQCLYEMLDKAFWEGS